MQFDRADWSHLAAGPVARGWACALPSYTLAPEARIAATKAEALKSVEEVASDAAGAIVSQLIGTKASAAAVKKAIADARAS